MVRMNRELFSLHIVSPLVNYLNNGVHLSIIILIVVEYVIECP
jgi:hypothetical protein